MEFQNYLDLNMPCNVIQQQVAQRNRYLVETEPWVLVFDEVVFRWKVSRELFKCKVLAFLALRE